MMNALIILLIFGSATLIWLSIAFLAMRRWSLQHRLQQVFEGLVDESTGEVGRDAREAGKSNLVMVAIKELLEKRGALAHFLSQGEPGSLKSRLIMAGFRRDDAVAVYQGARIALALLFPTVYLLSQLVAGAPTSTVLALSLGFAAVGFYLPISYVGICIDRRQKQISKALPNALDMLVVCVEAGLGLDAAVKRVGEELAVACPELSEELQLMSLELRAGKSRVEAFKEIGNRTGVDEVKAWAALMIQTDRFGTNIAGALRTHADGMRTKRRQRLEAEAAKTAVKLLFPLVLCIFPAIFVVMVGPAILQILQVFARSIR